MENIFAIIILVSFILLIIGVFSPKTSLFWDKKNEPTRKRSFIVYFLLFIISFILFGVTSDSVTDNNDSSKSSNNSNKVKVKENKKIKLSQQQIDSIAKFEKTKLYEERKAQTITAKNLYANYEANEVSADQKFKGKSFYITGVVDEIKKDFMDDIYVTLKTGQIYTWVHCYLDDENTAAKLVKGQKVTFKGECDGMIVTMVTMKDCQIAKNLSELK